ncbi:MAG: SPOR domain-containing protein [Candidatus Cloacimonetes bacterium]|nr:SPOR domain-containing protein [Candidatus Cloacimonadota bacterium]
MKKEILILLILVNTIIFVYGNTTQKDQYNAAKKEIDTIKMKQILEGVYQEDNSSLYGQQSLFELAKLAYFERDFKSSISKLKKIYHENITDKQYWLAKAYLKIGKNQLAIVSSQIYIAESDDRAKIENAYFLIADAYLQQNMYKRAYNTLESLRTSKYINNNIALLHYTMGICKEKQGKYTQALMFYKKLKQDFPYDQYCYLADDRIYNLGKEKKLELDPLDITSFRKNDIEDDTKAATGEDLKIYLQVGAFSSEASARQYGEKIKVVGYNHIVFSKIKDSSKLYVVAAGPFDEKDDLKEIMQKLRANDFSFYVIKRY